MEATTIQMPRGFWKPFYRKIPKLSDLHLTQVAWNSEVVCRLCRGSSLNAINSDATDTYRIRKCLFCKGSRVQSTRESSHDKR